MNWAELVSLSESIRRLLVMRYRNTAVECINDAVAEARYRFIRTFDERTNTTPLQGSAARAWLLTTATRLLARDWHRTTRLLPLDMVMADHDTPGDIHAANISTHEWHQATGDPAAQQFEVLQELGVLLNQLSPLLRDVIIRHDIEGIPLVTIAENLGCNAATIRQRHIRAIRQLRALRKHLGYPAGSTADSSDGDGTEQSTPAAGE
jgi:RNA polymerase sigma factor (sigma-70 family)